MSGWERHSLRQDFFVTRATHDRGFLVAALILLLTLLTGGTSANTQQSDYPIMDKVAQKVIDKYQKTSCEDLKAQKQDPEPPSAQQVAMKQEAIGLLKGRSEDARTVPEQSGSSYCEQNVRMRHDSLMPQGVGCAIAGIYA
jgi:predicted NodU family carbamoyl transferase